MRTLPELLSHDLVAGTRPDFLALAAEAQAELRPEGFLELRMAAEIVRTSWCLDQLAALAEEGISPAQLDAQLEARRLYRERLSTSLRRNTIELRRLQTDRILKERAGLDLPAAASTREILRFEKTNPGRTAAQSPQPEIRKNEPMTGPVPTSIEEAEAHLHAQIEAEERRELAEFARRTKPIPRNAPCTCGSGEKYKRCCGKDAPPVPGDWRQSLKTAA